MSNKRERINEIADEHETEMILWNEYDECIIGVVRQNNGDYVVGYSYNMIVEQLMSDGLSREDAEDHIGYNIIGGYLGPGTPVMVYDVDEF